MKRMVSLFLALCLMATTLPLSAYAEESPAPTAGNDVTVEGTNDFGELLSDSLEETQEEQSEEERLGYSLADLTFNGATATVTYKVLEEANLVVGVYTEDGQQLVASGNTVVEPDSTTATVTIEGEMPEYFLAKAFLVDTYDFSPLCDEYTTPMYTQEMQELLASTVNDYEADRVLILSDDQTTNFAVYAENTRRITASDSINVLTDNENGTYTITNADENFTTLTVGDVFSYEYSDGDMLIVKVASISVDGSTVTITEDENIEMSDVFSQVKVEAQADTNDLQYAPEGADEAIEYLGSDSGQSRMISPMSTRSGEDVEIKFKINEKKFENEDGDKVTITGMLSLTMDFNLEYYITPNEFYAEFTDVVEMDAGIEVKGKAETAIPLGYLFLTPIPSVTIDFTPSLVARTSGTIKNTIHGETTLGFTYQTGEGLSFAPCTAPTFTLVDYDVNGSLFLGLDFKPRIKVISKRIFSVDLKLESGANIKGTMIGAAFEADEAETHTCQKCVDGKVDLVLKIEPTLKVLNKRLELTVKLDTEAHLLDFYYSVDHNEFGIGTCPYRTFLITITTYGMDEEVAPGVTLNLSDEIKTTNDSGVAEYWLKGGDYVVYATWPSGHQRHHIFTVSEPANEVIPYFEPPTETLGVFGSIDSNAIADRGSLINQGVITNGGVEIGRWQIWSDKSLIISVPGSMDTRPYFNYYWNRYTGIRSAIFTGGITAIGAIFGDNEYLEEVEIPEGVTALYESFVGCPNLDQVELPSSLQRITGAFQRSGLTSVVIPRKVTELDRAFNNCTNLKDVQILGPVEDLGGSFSGCSSLETMEVPDTVTQLLYNEFLNCTSLKEVTLPEGLKTIGDNAFENCTSLENIIIPSTVESIGTFVFDGCSSLKTVQFTGDMPEIGGLFDGSSAVTVLYPKNNPTWTEEKLSEVEKNNSEAAWLWYDYDENGQMIVEVPGKDIVGEGTFGDNFTWTLQEDGTLTLAGTGEMPDFNASDENDRPWAQAHKFGIRGVKKVVIEPGVTSIGAFAFYGSRNLQSAEMADTVTSIGESAFSICDAMTTVKWSQNLHSIGSSAFSLCSALQDLDLPEGVQTIGNFAFSSCDSLTEVSLPDSISEIGICAFRSCSGLVKIELPDATTSLQSYTFEFCTSLETIILPKNLTGIQSEVANAECTNLKSLIFEGDAPSISYVAFPDSFYAQVVFYYPAGNATWTDEQIAYYAHTCIPYTLDGNGNMVIMEQAQTQAELSPEENAVAAPAPESQELSDDDPDSAQADPESVAEPDTASADERGIHAAPAPSPTDETAAPEEETYDLILPQQTASSPSLLAAVGGEYGKTDTGAKTASFTGLKPNESYLLLVLASAETETPLASDNLLYVTQGVSDESGNLQFTYLPRVKKDTVYVVACGPSNKDLADAEITVPTMYDTGSVQTVRPTIVYDGETLTEGTDYVLVGQVSATDPGDYQCQARGIYNYTGLVTIQYTVSERPPEITSSTYKISEGFLFLPTATTVEELLPALTGQDIQITAADGTDLTDTSPVGTGATLRQGGGKPELVAVYYGDLDGNGIIDTSDLLVMRRVLLRLITLEGAPLLAATPVSQADRPSTSDLLQMRRVLLRLADSMVTTS